MSNRAYYEQMKRLASDVRMKYSVTTPDLSLSALRKIYRAEGITLTLWPHKLKKVRAMYHLVDGEPHVMLAKRLPTEPRIFSMCHELKHHLCDRELAESRLLACQERSGNVVEIGAEVFAAELIYPEKEFSALIAKLGITAGTCSIDDVLALKRSSIAPISYTFLLKRLKFLGFVDDGAFDSIQWTKMEEERYGIPFYKRFRRRKVQTAT